MNKIPRSDSDILLNTITLGSLTEVQEVLNNCNLTLNDETRDFALFINAIDRNDEERIDIIKLLLNKGCQINIQDQNLRKLGTCTPLYHAINKFDIQVTEMLLINGASLNDKYDRKHKIFDLVMTLVGHDIFDLVLKFDNDKRITPIHVACMKGDMNVIEFFINYGVSEINSPAWRNYTPLHLAVMYKHKEIIKLLITHGADINIKDLSQRTPMELAVYSARKTDDWTICDYLLQELPYLEDSSGYGTFLHAAIKHKRLEVIIYLLIRGDSICIKNKEGQTPLHMAYYDAYETNCGNRIVDLLLSYNSHIHENPADKNSLTHLHIACLRNDIYVTRHLLIYKADITAKYGNYALTPLHFAVYQLNPNEEIIDTLLKEHEKICDNPVDAYGLSHFHIACSRDLPQVVQKFLETGVDVNQKVSDNGRKYAGYAPLHIAVINRRVDIIRLLLENSLTCVNIQSFSDCSDPFTNYNYTPIDFAPIIDDSEEDEDIFNMLVRKQANVLRKTLMYNGKSLLEVLCERGHIKRVRNILNYCKYIPNLYREEYQRVWILCMDIAIKRGHTAIAYRLKTQKSNLFTNETYERIFLEVACEKKYIEEVHIVGDTLDNQENVYVWYKYYESNGWCSRYSYGRANAEGNISSEESDFLEKPGKHVFVNCLKGFRRILVSCAEIAECRGHVRAVNELRKYDTLGMGITKTGLYDDFGIENELYVFNFDTRSILISIAVVVVTAKFLSMTSK